VTTDSTATELRKTGISVVGDMRWGTHFCYFYETKQDLLETQVLYFKAGLESKECCVWVVSQALSVEEAKHALGLAVPDLDRHLAEGALEIHRHDEWYLRDGRWDSQRVLQSWREKINRTAANGYVGLRASGDGGWVQNGDWMAFREYEMQVNAMVANQRGIVLCTYPLATSPGDRIFDVACIHEVAVARRNGRWEMVETPDLKQAKAEIKKLNQELEQKVEERTRELAATNEAFKAEIAERKLAEEALRRAENRLRLVIDTIPTMAWSVRPDGVVDFLNQRWMDYAGLSLEQYVEDPTGPIHPDDIPRVMEKWRAQMAIGEGYEDEMRLRRADGEYRWFLVLTEPLRDARGNVVRWYGSSIDIEDRKQAEEKLRHSKIQLAQAQRLAHIGSWDWDLRTNAVTWSDELYHIFGLRPGTISVAGEVDRFIHPDDLDLGWDTVKRAVASKEPYDYYHRILRPDGTERIARSRGSIMSDERGEPIKVFGATQDVTELKRAEKDLEEAGRQLRFLSRRLFEIQEEERRHLARELHDEIGQTLTAAKINLRIIAPDVPAKITNRLDDSIQLLDRLLVQVRQLSLDLHPSLLDDLGLAAALRSLLDQQGRRGGLRTQFHATEPFEKLDARIQIAAFRIAQEAITNVLRHANAQFIRLHLETDRSELRMKIVDDGKGFDVAAIERHAHEGAAFGLTGMKERTALAGGHIDISSAKGKGTTVEVSLPLHAARDETPSPGAAGP
jgi:PAS domain S-box-containing protein